VGSRLSAMGYAMGYAMGGRMAPAGPRCLLACAGQVFEGERQMQGVGAGQICGEGEGC